MDVSVIIPAYNCEKTISLLLDALIQQKTRLKYEVIVVNNGSLDNTCEALNSYKDIFPVPLLITEQPRGATISAVRNYGVRYSRGQILAFIDSDCEPPKDWIQDGHSLLNKEGNDVLLAGGCCPPVNGTWVERAWNSIRAGHKAGSVFVHGANFFISKSLFNEVGGFREDIETSEDYDLGRRVAKDHKVISVPEFSVVHYGEANTLYKKIAKERWYARNSLETLASNAFYKPFWISLMFLLNMSLIIISMIFENTLLIITSIIMLITIPCFLSYYFCRRASNFSYLIELIPICTAYLVGRSIGIIDSIVLGLLKVNRKL